MAYNPSWLENMYMGKYESEEERLKRLQDESINGAAFGNSGAGAGLESILGDNPRSSFQPSQSPVHSSYRTYQTENQSSPSSDIMSGLSAASKSSTTQDKPVSGKLGAADYVGLGLQLVGAMQADKETKRQEEKEDKKYSEAKQMSARQREDELRQVQEQLQRQDRGMNLQGLDMLAQQRERAYSKRVSNSMANTFMKAMRG